MPGRVWREEAIAAGLPHTLGADDTDLALFSRNLVEKALNEKPSTGRSKGFWQRFRKGVEQILSN